MPQPSLRSSTKKTSTSAASHTIAEPAGAVSGDRCELTVMAGATAATISTPTGFTELEAQTTTVGFGSKRFFRNLDGLESWPLTIAQTGSTSRLNSILLCLNPNGGSTWVNEADGGGPVTTTSATGTPPSVTGVTDCIYITVYMNDGNQSLTTPPSGMTEAETHLGFAGVMAKYTEQRASGAVQKSLVWSASDGVHSYGLILSIGSGSTDTSRRRRNASVF